MTPKETKKEVKKKGRKKASSNYFTADTDVAIIAYNNEKDFKKRAKIFTDHLYYPFYKLVENIIHTFKFYYTDVENIEDLKHELISLIIEEKIHYFDPTRGAKAYSYFGTIIKRHLIVYNNKNYKYIQQRTDTADLEFQTVTPIDSLQSETISLSSVFDIYTEEMFGKLDTLFTKQQDKQTADAILTLFQKRKTLELFNKKALYILIREMTGVDTLNVTKVIKVLKEEFYTLYYELLEDYRIEVKE